MLYMYKQCRLMMIISRCLEFIFSVANLSLGSSDYTPKQAVADQSKSKRTVLLKTFVFREIKISPKKGEKGTQSARSAVCRVCILG